MHPYLCVCACVCEHVHVLALYPDMYSANHLFVANLQFTPVYGDLRGGSGGVRACRFVAVPNDLLRLHTRYVSE